MNDNARAAMAVQFDDGSRTPAELIAAYEAGVGLLRRAVAGLTADELRARPVPGRWSTLEVLCHVADSEQFLADRLKRTLAMDCPLLIAAEGWRYPGPLSYHEREPAEELELVDVTRRHTARILKRVPPGAWSRTAVHTETGLVTLRQLLLHPVRHLEGHVAFVDEKRRALGKG